MRQSDALVAVIREFESDVVPHPKGSVDPVRDLEDLQLALVLADLTTMEKRLDRLQRTLKVKKDVESEHERDALLKCKEHLEAERPLRDLDLAPEAWKLLRGFGFLSQKPLLVVINVGEGRVGQEAEILERCRACVTGANTTLIAFCAQIEMEIAQLPDEEREGFLADMGIAEPALGRMIQKSYELMGLISFFTAGEPEVRAWTVPNGATAVQSADVIHSDIARGFIRAEVVAYDEYVAHGGIPGSKQAGKFRLEGKEYVVADGDVIYFRFNV